MKNHIPTIRIFLSKENIFDDQITWGYLKYESLDQLFCV